MALHLSLVAAAAGTKNVKMENYLMGPTLPARAGEREEIEQQGLISKVMGWLMPKRGPTES